MSSDLTLQELQRVYMLHGAGKKIQEIADKLNRSYSAISRELSSPKPGYWVEWDNYSRARYSFEQRAKRRSRSRKRFRLKSASLRQYVAEQIELRVSPELISIRLEQQKAKETIGHQAIYNWINQERPELKKFLVRKGKRGSRGGKRGKKKTFKDSNKRSIHSRDAVVEQRKRFGDWEGDTVVSSKSKACVYTLRERKSRYIRFILLDDCTANSAYNAALEALLFLPQALRQTITFDNGSENSCYAKLEQRLKLLTFFCDPYASHQRGCVENGNGFLRQYLPKGTNFRYVTRAQLREIQDRHNNRPMKCLAGRTPAEVFFEQLRNHSLAA